MLKLIKFAWRHRRRLALPVFGLAAAFTGFYYAISLDEATKRHLKKKFSEVRKMPGRLLT